MTGTKLTLPQARKNDAIRADAKEKDDKPTDDLLAMLTQDSGSRQLTPSVDVSTSGASGAQSSPPQDASAQPQGELKTPPQVVAAPPQGNVADANITPPIALTAPPPTPPASGSSPVAAASIEKAKSPTRIENASALASKSLPEDPAASRGPAVPKAPEETQTAPEEKPTAIVAATPGPTGKILPDKPIQPETDHASFPELLRATQSHAGANAAQAIQSHIVANEPFARPVQTPISSPHWADDVGNQLTWMVGKNEGKADLVLNPPQLGRIEVSLSISGDQATASFVSANPEVRDALQGSLPRLREILADTGIFLGQASIGADSSRQGGNNAETGRKSADDSFSAQGRTLIGSLNAPSSTIWTSGGKGLVDLFA
jgi:flagellar hook-length control protein FliK